MSVTDKNRQLSSHQTAELCIVIMCQAENNYQVFFFFSEVRESGFKGHQIVLTRLVLVCICLLNVDPTGFRHHYWHSLYETHTHIERAVVLSESIRKNSNCPGMLIDMDRTLMVGWNTDSHCLVHLHMESVFL